jgi:hypothetical protein
LVLFFKKEHLAFDELARQGSLMTQAPPAPSATEIKQTKAIFRQFAIELREDMGIPIDHPGMAWLEQRPHCVLTLLDIFVTAANASKRDDLQVTAARLLLGHQLETLRYRTEAGHDWAQDLLGLYQDRLVALLAARDIAQDDWFELVKLLTEAKVPVRSEIAEAVAEYGGDAAAPADVSQGLRIIIDQIAEAGDDPFMVVQGLAETGAMMPPGMRAFVTHELALSAHAVMRETVPLHLLDPDPSVRQAAAAALEQIANPETFSPTMLRRTLLVRNWVPAAEREAIDRLVRKARLKGVECAQWAPAPALEIYASFLDGAGAQSLIITTPKGRTGLFAGLLLKLSFGVRDAWCEEAAARREINRAIKDTQHASAWSTVNVAYLNMALQHHIARGLEQGNLPMAAIVQIAEAIGAVDWKDRSLDVAAETAHLFAALDEASRQPAAINASLQRSGFWIETDEVLQSWFEDDAEIRALTKGKPKPKQTKVAQRIRDEILPARREIWAEKALLTGLWLQAGTAAKKQAVQAQDCMILAHELLSDRPLRDIPAMEVIAGRSAYVAFRQPW